MISNDNRNIGIKPLQDVQWGTHSCYFYQTKKDLLDFLVPYFKLGLESNEYCLWVISDDITRAEAEELLKTEIKEFERYLIKGQIAIIPYTEYYVKDNVLNLENTIKHIIGSHKLVLEQGYDGIRASGDLRWLKKKDLDAFINFENRIHEAVSNLNFLGTCTYPINKFKKAEILNISNSHRFVIFKNNGTFDVIESSEQKKLEDEIQKISVLSSGVAHDFNNLLTIIKGNTDMALLLMDEEKKHPIYEHLLEIQVSIKSAKPLVEQLYNLSRKQSNDSEVLKIIRINRSIIKLLEMLTLFFQRNKETPIETELDLDPELWPIKGDSGKIEQVILNLIMNAKDAMPEGGRITITTCNVVPPKARIGEYISISIADTGIGMEQELLEHIFDPFFTTKGSKGTGLGLQIVKQIIEEHGGWIEVFSELNKGTTFKIFLPIFVE